MKVIQIELTDLPGPDPSVLDYCRKLLKEGENPKTKVEAYRGAMLCLTIENIEEGAKWWAHGNYFVDHNPRYAKNRLD